MGVDLSFTQDPEWRREREKRWEEIEARLRGEFTKKKIECEKRYYLDTQLLCQDDEKLAINDGTLLMMFPLRNQEGWEYVCRELMRGRKNTLDKAGYYSLLHGLVESAIGDLGPSWTHEEHCALFDWLLGDHFQQEIVPPVPIGPRGIQPVHKLEANRIYRAAISWLSFWLRDGVKGNRRPVWASKMDYLMSLIPLVDERAFNIEKYDRFTRKNGTVIVDMQTALQRIIGFMKENPPENIPSDGVAERQAFLDEFRQRLESLDPKPGQLAELLEQLNT